MLPASGGGTGVGGAGAKDPPEMRSLAGSE